MNISLTPEQVMNMVPEKVNFFVYGDLEGKTFSDLFHKANCCLLLYRTNKNIGHFCCLTKLRKVITFFDPYGIFSDDQLDFVDDHMNEWLNQEHTWLSKILLEAINSGYKIEYNAIPLQSLKNGISTCGSQSAMWMNFYKHMNIDAYGKFILMLCKDMKITPDNLVTKMRVDGILPIM